MSAQTALALQESQLAEVKKDNREMKKKLPVTVTPGVSTAISLATAGASGSMAAVLEEKAPSVPPVVVDAVAATALLTASAFTANPDTAEALAAAGRGPAAVVTHQMAKQATKKGLEKLKQALPPGNTPAK